MRSRAEVALEDPEAVESTITVLSNFNGQALSCWDASDARLRASARGGIQPYKYAWSNGQTTELLFGLPQGEYTLTAFDANGCVDIVKATVQPPAQLKVKIAGSSNYHGYGTSCNGTTDGTLLAEASGGTGNHKYLWPATNVVSPLHTNLPAGTHTVIATDANACSARVDGIITNPPKLIAKAIQIRNLLCYGGTDGEIRLQGEGGTGVYMYSATGIEWQPEASLTKLGSGTINAQVRDENGCSAATFVSLAQPEKIVINFDNVKPALCGDPKGQASAVVSGGAGGYAYWWHDSENRVVGNSPVVSGLRAGIFSVTVEDANYCQAKNYTSITSSDGPTVKITDILPASCSYNADGKARVEVMAGNGPFSIQWQNGQTTYEALGLGLGSHLVQVTDANDCAVVESVDIPAPDALTLEVVEVAEPQCNGDCNGGVTVRALGGNGTYSYVWENFDGPEISNLCAGEYSVTVTDARNCVATHLIKLTQPASLELKEIFRQSPSCPETCDGKLEVMARGGTGELKLEWLDGPESTGMEGLCDGTYTATVKDTHGCTATETFTLQSPEVRSLDLGASMTLCEGQSHTLDAGEDWKTLVWSGNNGFHSTSRFVTLSDAGMYSLQATTHEGCVARDTFFLETSTDLLNAMFLLASQAFVKDTVVIIDISWPMPEAVTWRLPDAMKQLESSTDVVVGQFHSSGDYEVSITASLGECRDELTKMITILDYDAQDNQGGRLMSQNFLKEFTLYPNPNDGVFDVAVEFAAKSAMVLTVWNILTSRKVAQFKASGQKSYLQHIDLRPLSAGSYSLRLDYENGTRYVRFIVR